MTRTPPDFLRTADLQADFGLTVDSLRPHPGGFGSACWVVDDRWFVKVWHDPTPPTGLGVLQDLQDLGLPVPAPLPTISGKLHATQRGKHYAVFPYVRGRTATSDDWRQTARALRQVHALTPIHLPHGTLDEPQIRRLAEHLDHPWISDRRDEVAAAISRLDQVVARAGAQQVRQVICHTDLHGLNLLLDDNDQLAAILDWDQAVLGAREHDVWVAAEGPALEAFLTEYGARDLDPDHLEYALLSRGLRDMAARVFGETDRPGVDTWGFGRLARLDSDLARFRPYCRR
ncbi:aminoglycoside phosphotransferase [Kribbella flavida DSM 17836]|uniref:Aminoglycoside phosphotransferase n=1 Tax=Kribbella flavida (strain DSM 17836 / JCM 10339 / NBRC 14399) TaxID=479435 RepID=D2Q0A8_KRIFD|nr:phosphotransferase [Kribbella flavida]ADB31900.1 aminoglycoside phosphotransferase [Kribbella flavida DSM 17836]